MLNATCHSTQVLIFSPHPTLDGGVAAFNDALKQHFSGDVEATWFFTGQRPGLGGRLFRLGMPIFDALRLATLLAVKRPDVYHLNPSFDSRSILRDGLFLLVLRLFQRRRILVFFRGWDKRCVRAIARSKWKCGIFRWVYGYAARVLVLGSDFVDDLHNLGLDPEAIHRITTMFDGRLFRGVQPGRKAPGVRIIFLGRLVASKGIYELLEAFRRISSDDTDLKLMIAGDGEDRQRAEDWCRSNGIQDRVRFAGRVSGIEKAQLLLDSDIFVLPSYSEGCPNSMLEAMAAGLPLVVTAVGGIPDVVEDGVNGFFVSCRDPDSIEVTLRKLLADPSLRESVSIENRQTAWQHYEATVVTGHIEKHYQSIADT